MSNQQAAGPTLAEGTIVERKGDDIRDRQSPEVIHFRRKQEEAAKQAKPDTTVTVDLPPGPFLSEAGEDQAPTLEEALGQREPDQPHMGAYEMQRREDGRAEGGMEEQARHEREIAAEDDAAKD
jgi:hypothetical protein